MNSRVPIVHIIAVAFHKFGELKVFVQSWLNQNRDNWVLTLIHDGPNSEFDFIMSEYAKQSPDRIYYQSTPQRFNDYGHSLRELGLQEIRGDYVMLTNADNYFVPRTVEFINDALARSRPDVIMFDMVHSHDRPGGRDVPAYSFFETRYERRSIDMSAAIVKSELARAAGFRDKTYAGDASYFEDVLRARAPDPFSIVKIPRVLVVHN